MRLKFLLGSVTLCAILALARPTSAAVTVGVDPAAPWGGWMNVFDTSWNYQWGSAWGTADLNAAFAGDVLTLEPNYSIAVGDPPPNPYWWNPDGTGAKIMDANFYVEDSAALPGQEVTFEGLVLSNTLDTAYQRTAFIKDFAPDYSSFTTVTASLAPGPFSITLQTVAAGHHVQYGFEIIGLNARLEDRQRLGSIQVTAAPVIPEPATLVLLGSSALGLLARRRKA